MKSLKRITAPIKFRKDVDYFLKPDSSNVLISCRNQRLNMHSNSKYPYWNPRYLASYCWKNVKKSDSDYFTINPTSKHQTFSENISFEDLGLQPELVNTLLENKIVKPTDIQSQAIPIISNGLNTIIGSETGSGKTLAYLLPLLIRLYYYGSRRKDDTLVLPSVFCIAPTYELCSQIYKVCQLFEKLDYKSSLLSKENLPLEPCDILISTPLLIEKSIKSKYLSVENLISIVFDEADDLFDDSFIEHTNSIISNAQIQTSKPIENQSIGTQVILCQATNPLCQNPGFDKYLPIQSFVKVKSDNMHYINPTVSHKFYRIAKEKKEIFLLGMLKRLKKIPSTIIFCNTNTSVDKLSQVLTESNIQHVKLSKSSLEKRQENFNSFQSGEVQIMVSTDLGSRGLDTIKATHVINFDFPLSTSHYLHRAGRVGRVGSPATAKVTNIVTMKIEVAFVQIIETAVRLNKPIIMTKDIDVSYNIY